MNIEIHFPMASEEIYEAEHQRVTKRVKKAVEMTQPVVEFPIENFSNLLEYDKKGLLMASRIYVVASTSRAKGSKGARAVARHLGEAKVVIDRVYNNPDTQIAAHQIKTDLRGDAYEYHTEMARDNVRYMLTLAALTGNPELLQGALERMDKLIGVAQEPSAKTLSEFERARLLFKADGSEESFDQLRAKYRDAIEASKSNGKWERVASVAAMFQTACSGRTVDENTAWKDFMYAFSRDKSVVKIFPAEMYKHASDSIRHWLWRKTTPKGEDYSQLELS